MREAYTEGGTELYLSFLTWMLLHKLNPQKKKKKKLPSLPRLKLDPLMKLDQLLRCLLRWQLCALIAYGPSPTEREQSVPLFRNIVLEYVMMQLFRSMPKETPFWKVEVAGG